MDGEPARPTVVTVMAEHGIEDPVWDRPYGTGYPLDLAALGASPDLVGRLRTWNEELMDRAITDDWPSEDQRRWADRDRPVRERRHRRPRDR